jgi:archaellum component FlaD/FlaE
MYTQEIIGLKVPKTDKVYKVVVTLPDMQIREIIKKRWIEYLKSQVQPKSIRRFVNFYNSVEGSEIQLIKKK